MTCWALLSASGKRKLNPKPYSCVVLPFMWLKGTAAVRFICYVATICPGVRYQIWCKHISIWPQQNSSRPRTTGSKQEREGGTILSSPTLLPGEPNLVAAACDATNTICWDDGKLVSVQVCMCFSTCLPETPYTIQPMTLSWIKYMSSLHQNNQLSTPGHE